MATTLIEKGAGSEELNESPIGIKEVSKQQHLTPPKLIEYVEAKYPKEAFEQNLEAEVSVRIQIDETGTVLNVDVVEPVGHGFDEAASNAIMRFRFQPAMRGGKPIAAQLIYRYRFFINTEPISDETSLPESKPKEEVSETILSADDEELSDDSEPLSDLYELVVRDRRPSREVSRREVTVAEINKIPGTSGDALRALHSQPGVARASFMDGEIVIRGSSPADSAFFFDSLSTPLLYHFGSYSSIINSDLLKQIDLYPGNFSVRYGRAIGGVVNVTTQTPNTDRLHAYIDADFWDVTAFIEGPLGKHWSVAVSARRSYIEDIYQTLFSSDEDPEMSLPRYYDFQVLADYHPNAENNLQIFIFGTDDQTIEIQNKKKRSAEQMGSDRHLFTSQIQLQWDHLFSDRCDNRLSLGFGYQRNRYDLESATISENWDAWPLLIRDELTWHHSDTFILKVGTDTEFQWKRVKQTVPWYHGVEDEFFEPTSYSDERIVVEGNRFHVNPAGYAELELTAVPMARFIYGVRADYYSAIQKWGLDPRIAIHYNPNDTKILKAGLGLFHRPPGELGSTYLGNPELDLTWAIHYSIGVEQKMFENVEISVEGFYKDLRRLVTPSSEMIKRDGAFVSERYDNEGKGRSFGMEAQIEYRGSSRFFGWVSYTLMKSERRDMDGADWRPFDYDQRHILTLLGSFHVGWGIDVGFRFQLASGNPYTPVIGFNYDVDSEMYYPIWGEYNEARLPLFHQLDLRVDKKWQWKPLALTIYLDVRNVYNRKNVEGIYFNWGESEKMHIYGLSVLPSGGIRLEY